jgi:hypothetical protein
MKPHVNTKRHKESRLKDLIPNILTIALKFLSSYKINKKIILTTLLNNILMVFMTKCQK